MDALRCEPAGSFGPVLRATLEPWGAIAKWHLDNPHMLGSPRVYGAEVPIFEGVARRRVTRHLQSYQKY